MMRYAARVLRAVPDPDLDAILSGVSRSFYLSLAILPRPVRTQLSVAYLVARAADTIADTRVVRADRRLSLLDGLRGAIGDERRAPSIAEAVRRQLEGATQVPAERLLLERLGDCLVLLARVSTDDRARIRRVLDALIRGMERDLTRFPTDEGAAPAALATLADLDEHCYFAAGCVGEFWTEMTAAHLPAVAHLAAPSLVARGVRLGKALQLVNVIRDAPADLAGGRCYLPSELLQRHGLAVADLVDPARRRRARPLLDELRALALDHVDGAWPYVEAIPPTAPRLRLACVWPLWIGLATLRRLAALDDPLDPRAPTKVPRREVYRAIAESAATVAIDPLLRLAHARRRAAAT
jgi:farnesyl-diphosphate farnesyltransferase